MPFHRIELDLKTVTPAFIGGSDPVTSAEWTAKSVRGNLRWWFRAIAGGEMHGNPQSVRAAENALFGSTDRKSTLRVLAPPVREENGGEPADGRPLNESQLAEQWGNSSPAVRGRLRLSRGATNPIAYLGYGPIAWKREQGIVYARARLRPGQPLRLIVQWRGKSPEPDPALRSALWCWLNLGGIGGRSRRGFGSLEYAGPFPEPTGSLDQFQEQAISHLSDARNASGPAEWSHFTTATRIYVSTSPYDTWQEALSAAGAWLIAYRRRYGLSSDERAAKRNRDYVWLNSPPPPKGVPDRAGFGLPLPFGKGDLVAAWRAGKKPNEGDHEEGRRASPLLIHVGRFEGKHHLVLTHMPALLVPPRAEIHFRGTSLPPTPEQQGIVQDFLDDLEGPAKKKIARIL
jgi:CRISPR-associated protein Cmr1